MMKIKATVSSDTSCNSLFLTEKKTEEYVLALSGGGLSTSSTILAMNRMRELRDSKSLTIRTKKFIFTFEIMDSP